MCCVLTCVVHTPMYLCYMTVCCTYSYVYVLCHIAKLLSLYDLWLCSDHELYLCMCMFHLLCSGVLCIAHGYVCVHTPILGIHMRSLYHAKDIHLGMPLSWYACIII